MSDPERPAAAGGRRRAPGRKQAGDARPGDRAVVAAGGSAAVPAFAEAAPGDAHEWISFEDPDEDRTWLFDLTFLLSGWSCIYGRGCQGVLTAPAPELAEGCCSYGAHFTGERDVARVKAAARELRPEDWQFKDRARHGGVVRTERDGTRATRLIDGACIFLNRPGFPGGPGCALHRAALAAGRLPLETKPDVCWQLPLRREDTEDATGHVVSIVTQWDRRHWGEGGASFAWWCTEAPEAYRAASPVYRTMAAELIAMVGPAVFHSLVRYLQAREEAASKGNQLLPHPAVRRRKGAESR